MIAKTKEEIEILRESGRRLARHVRMLGEKVVPGATGAELEEWVRKQVESEGDELAFMGYPSGKNREKFPGGLCVSVNDVIVHSPGYGNHTPFIEGDVVCIDFGIKHRGLITDHASTVIAGKAKSEEDEKLLRGTKEALMAAIKEAKVGNTTGDIGEAAEKVAKKYGFGFPKNLSGHGVGKEVHEPPHIPNYRDARHETPLVENMVIAIEPMMTLGSGDLFVDKDGFSYRTKDGSHTAHFEHTVLVTKNGPEILTKE